MIKIIRIINYTKSRFKGFFYSLIMSDINFNWSIGELCTFRGNKITIGKRFKCGHLARIECFGNNSSLVFGNNVRLGNNVHIGTVSSVTIGDNVLIGSNVLIIDHNHGYYNDPNNHITSPSSRPLVNKGSIIIEDNVWICDSVAILGGSIISKGSIIPFGSVVNDRT